MVSELGRVVITSQQISQVNLISPRRHSCPRQRMHWRTKMRPFLQADTDPKKTRRTKTGASRNPLWRRSTSSTLALSLKLCHLIHQKRPLAQYLRKTRLQSPVFGEVNTPSSLARTGFKAGEESALLAVEAFILKFSSLSDGWSL